MHDRLIPRLTPIHRAMRRVGWHCACRVRAHRGFTLMEMIVVLGVAAALAAAIAPVAFTYVRDAQRAQAQNDVNQIAAAIGNFMKSTGLPPYKNTTSADKIPAWQTGPPADFDCLHGSQGIGFSSAEDSTTGTSWATCYTTSTTKDTIENHLITNTPGGLGTKLYKTTGKTKWEGPYLPSIDPDPWGKPFLINIKQIDPAASTPRGAWVISAGPNGVLETAFDQNAGSAITASGDDIIARVK